MFIEEDKQTETNEVESAETEEKQTTEQTEAKTETEQSETEESSTKDETEKEVSQITLNELMEREDVQRAIQSVSDRAVAKAEKRLSEKAQSRESAAHDKVIEDEKRKLVEEEDFDTLGRHEADKMKLTEDFLDHATKFSAVITSEWRKQYSPILGEEETDRLIDEVEAIPRSSIIDVVTALSNASQQKAVSSATAKAVKEATDKMKTDFEALKTELGVGKRSEDVKKGETSSSAVSKTRSETASTEEMTYETASTMYGEGDMSYEEFKPFKDQHDKERQV